MNGRASAAALALLIGCVAGAAAFAATIAGRTEPWSCAMDTGSFFLGQTVPAFRAWFAGTVPHWSDLLWGGFPLIGDCSSAALYPLHVVPYLTTRDSPLRFFDVAFVLHLGIFAAGCAALVRRLGGSAAAAALAGALGAAAPFAHFSAVAFFPVFGAQAWWPWTFVAAEALARPGTRLAGAMALGWIALAAQVLAGMPEQALYSGAVAAAWILFARTSLGPGARIGRLALLGVGAAALAAPQLLPTAMLLPWTQRAEPAEHAQLASFWLADPRQLLVPTMRLEDTIPGFLGAATLLLAAVAVVARRPRALLLAGVAGVTFALALGPQAGLYEWLQRVPPFDHFRSPVKLYAFTEFTTRWLAALGADALWRRGTRAARAAAAVLVLAALAEHAVRLAEEPPLVRAARETRLPDRYRHLETLTMLRRADATRPPAVVYDAGGPFGGDYARSLGALLDISSLRTVSVGLVSPAHLTLLDRPNRGMLNIFGVSHLLVPAHRCERYDRLRWPRIHTDADVCVLANPQRHQRYAAMERGVPAEDATQAIRHVRSGPRPPEIPVVAPEEAVRDPRHGAVLVQRYAAGSVRLVAAFSSPGLLLVRESFAPGWTVRVDGRPLTPYPAAGIFFAVPIPPGAHTVDLEYETPGLRAGVLVCGGWSLAAGLAAAWGRRRRRRRAVSSGSRASAGSGSAS